MAEIVGNSIVIQGGASEMGRLLPSDMAREGGHVALWDIHEGNLEKGAGAIWGALAWEAYGCPCEVFKRARVYEAAEGTALEFGAACDRRGACHG